MAPPPRYPRRERRRRAAFLGVVGLLVGLAGFAAAVAAGQDEPSPRPVAADHLVVPAARGLALPAPRPADDATRGRLRATGRPVRIDIPAIGVHAPVVRIGLNRDRTLEVPADYTETGWWKGGARPGEAGPAVIVGHVDSTTGPAVYYRLGDLRRGDTINIMGADRRVVRFRVRHLARFPKDRFPTQRVYGPTRRPTLRLITCSGQFDRATGHYLENTVVFASLA